MTTPKTPTTAALAARLQNPPRETGESLAATTTAQIATVVACADYVKQPAVQAAVKALQTDNATLEADLAAYAKAKAALPALEAACNADIALVRRDRHTLAGAITNACNGSTAAIAAYGAVPAGAHVALAASTEAPLGLGPMKVKVSGTIRAKCDTVAGAGTYLWALLGDPNAAPTSVPPIMTTGSRLSVPGQTVGHVVYLRVSVVRRRGGPSAWSDALQITVR